MAFETGTATNFNDFVSKLVAFLTTNPTLVAANRQWTLMRNRRNNIKSVSTDMQVSSSGNDDAKPQHIMRVDARVIQYDNQDGTPGRYQASGISSGNYIQFECINAIAPTKLRLKSPPSYNYKPVKFKLAYSDNGQSWTETAEFAMPSNWPIQTWVDISVGTLPAKKHWRYIITELAGGGTFGLEGLLFLDNNDNILNHFGDELIFKAPGASGNEAIYTGIRAEWNEASDWYNLFLNGYIGFDDNFYTSFWNQPGAIPGYGSSPKLISPMVTLWNDQTPYWFVASGRVFKFGAKVSTVYVGGYMGFILPYASPAQYPYPLAVGGNMVPDYRDDWRGSPWRFSANSMRNSMFTAPGGDNTDTTSGRDYRGTFMYRNSAGEWHAIVNYGASSETNSIYPPNIDDNFQPTGYYTGMWPHFTAGLSTGQYRDFRECVGGGYLFLPCIIVDRLGTASVIGELDGVYSVSGFGNAAENTGTFDGDTVVVFQNVNRTETYNYWGLRLN